MKRPTNDAPSTTTMPNLILRRYFILPVLSACFFLLCAHSARADRIVISAVGGIKGKVTDSTGAPVQGVSVKVSGTEQGVMTGDNGTYSIEGVPDNATLIFSHVGYLDEQAPVGGRSVINIQLRNNSTGLGEVLVVGYGTQKKATATGAISMVKGAVLQQSPAVNFTNTLAGRLPGLVAVNTSGEPGRDDATVRIRGANTLGDNSALIVVDGIAGRDMTGIRPEDVESVTVLKDASGAIYGSRAANGVILITTKRGRPGRPEAVINATYGRSSPTVIPKMANSATYATMVNEINAYSGQALTYTDEEIRKFRDGSDPWLYPNTDWFKEVFENSAAQTRSDISVRGGSENMKYFISGGYSLQDAIFKNSSAKYSQTNFRSNIDGRITKDISLSFDVSGSQQGRNFAGNPFGYMVERSKPTFVAYYPGNKPAVNFQAGQNPVVLASDLLGYDHRKTYYFLSNVKLRIDLPWVKGLSLTGNVSYDKNIYNGKFWRTPYTLYSWDKHTYDDKNEPVVTGAPDGPYLTPELTQEFSDAYNATMNGLLNYEGRFNSHSIKFLAGVERITGTTMDLSAFRRGFISTSIDQMFAGADLDKNNGGSASATARLNYFGRVNYDYRQKYLLEFVWRYDGSYIFPKEHRFGFFPGVSAGWVISEESFFKDKAPAINYLKVMGSWGKTGNDRIDPYQYLSSYSFSTTPFIFDVDVQAKALNELLIANPNITWEVANQTNIGADVQLFQGALQVTANYFYNLRSNILTYRNASVPGSAGLTLPRENIGRVVNKGYEIEIAHKGSIGRFNYRISANGAVAKNKIKFWDESPGVPDYQRSTGQPMNAGLYYVSLGVFKDQADVDKYPHWSGAKPGDLIFKDVNGDNKIDGLDQVRYPKTDLPTFTGGFSIDLSYRDFFASMLFQGATGAVRTYSLESGLQGDFLEYDANGRWTADNPNASRPRTWNVAGYYWSTNNNTYWLRSNDYLRLKTAQLSYNVPKPVTDRIGINGLSVYVSGLNLLTFTKYKSFDPETVGDVYPLSKVYNFGIKLTL